MLRDHVQLIRQRVKVANQAFNLFSDIRILLSQSLITFFVVRVRVPQSIDLHKVNIKNSIVISWAGTQKTYMLWRPMDDQIEIVAFFCRAERLPHHLGLARRARDAHFSSIRPQKLAQPSAGVVEMVVVLMAGRRVGGRVSARRPSKGLWSLRHFQIRVISMRKQGQLRR